MLERVQKDGNSYVVEPLEPFYFRASFLTGVKGNVGYSAVVKCCFKSETASGNSVPRVPGKQKSY